MPNILWITFEDTSPRFGCYGDPLARSPAVDGLAAQGTVYERCFACAGVCAPSRAAVITGLFPTAIGAHHMRTTHANRVTPEMPTPYDCLVPHYARCLPEYFRAAGWYCSNNSKTDYQFRSPDSAWDRNADGAHWRDRAAGQPFFAVFNFTRTHESGMWPEQHPGPTQTDPQAVALPPYLPDSPGARRALAQHYDNIAGVDAQVAMLLRELDEDGLADDTIVVVWSDHGEGLPRAKRWLYDTGIRVPLVVRWPGRVAAGARDSRLVSLLDLGPTMLRACGLTVPCHLQGSDFLTAPPRAYVHACRDRFDESYDMVRAVRDGRFKYIRNCRPELPRLLWIPYRNRHPSFRDIWQAIAEERLTPEQAWFGETHRPAEELYDTAHDPWEQHDLAADPAHAAELHRLRAECDRHLEQVGDLGRLDEAVMKRLWYPDGVAPICAPVVFVPICAERPGLEATTGGEGRGPSDGMSFLSAPALLQLHCATQGASILWTDQSGATPHWRLYTAPIRLAPGQQRIRARAVRIGHPDSAERSLAVVVR